MKKILVTGCHNCPYKSWWGMVDAYYCRWFEYGEKPETYYLSEKLVNGPGILDNCPLEDDK